MGREGRGEVNPWKMLYGQVSKQKHLMLDMMLEGLHLTFENRGRNWFDGGTEARMARME
jgi:hypothetical protein